MSNLYTRTAEMHKRSIKRLIEMSDVTLTIHLPVPVQVVSVNPLFGDFTRESNKAGETKGPYHCLWYDALTARTVSRTGDSASIERVVESSPGQFRDATAFAEVWMQSVLLDQNDPMSKTWFDKALFVSSNGQNYKVLGYAKLGLSVSTPYSAMVALKGGYGYGT